MLNHSVLLVAFNCLLNVTIESINDKMTAATRDFATIKIKIVKIILQLLSSHTYHIDSYSLWSRIAVCVFLL